MNSKMKIIPSLLVLFCNIIYRCSAYSQLLPGLMLTGNYSKVRNPSLPIFSSIEGKYNLGTTFLLEKSVNEWL